MAKFKVGDEIVGNAAATDRYSTTIKGWRGKVVSLIEVSLIEDAHTSQRDIVVTGNFGVHSKYFDLFKSASPVEEKLEVYQIF